MKEIENTPLWVQLAWGNVGTRKLAMWMIFICIIFGFYCIPWTQYTNHPLVAKLSLINDWSWALSMMPLTIWYWVAARWVDKHDGWER